MKKHFLFLTILFFPFLESCRKQPLPAAESGEPVFYVRGSAGDVPLNLVAGTEDVRMLPDFYTDTTGMKVMSSQLVAADCASCYGITVTINDYKENSPLSPFRVDSALRLGHYIFSDKAVQPVFYKVQLRPDADIDLTGLYSWTLRTSGENDLHLSGYEHTIELDAEKTYTVTLKVEDATGCLASHNNIYRFGTAPQPQIRAARMHTNEIAYSFSAVSNGAGTETSRLWEFGDGKVSSENTPEHTFEPKGGGYYTTTLTVTDAKGDKRYAFYQVPGSLARVCTANMVAEVTEVPNFKPYSRITVDLRVPDGKVYSTSGFDQPSESDFEILNVQDYLKNAQGLPTKKYSVKFNCVLKNGSDEIILRDAEAVLAAAYQEI